MSSSHSFPHLSLAYQLGQSNQIKWKKFSLHFIIAVCLPSISSLSAHEKIMDSAFCAMLSNPEGIPLWELSTCLFFAIPMVVMVVLYGRMGMQIRSRTQRTAELGRRMTKSCFDFNIITNECLFEGGCWSVPYFWLTFFCFPFVFFSVFLFVIRRAEWFRQRTLSHLSVPKGHNSHAGWVQMSYIITSYDWCEWHNWK